MTVKKHIERFTAGGGTCFVELSYPIVAVPDPAVAARLNAFFAREARRALDAECTERDPKLVRTGGGCADLPAAEGQRDVYVTIEASVLRESVLTASYHLLACANPSAHPFDLLRSFHFTLPDGRPFDIGDAFRKGSGYATQLRRLIDRDLAKTEPDLSLEDGKPERLEFWLRDDTLEFFNLFDFRAAWGVTAKVPIASIANELDPQGPLAAWTSR